VLLVTGAAAYGLRFAVGWILDGIVYLVWFVDALPQTLVWFGLLAILFVLTLRLDKGRPRKAAAVPPLSEPARSDLARLTECIQQAESSPHARRELQRRLGQTAVTLRVKREAIPPRQAWDDVVEGRWPAHPDVQAVLHPERGRAKLVPRRGYVQQLARAVDGLWLYAQGGDFDGS
jgi:hypothetical protein